MQNYILIRIRKYRKEKGLNQEQVAELLGIDQKTYSNWERGRTEMTFTNIEEIAFVLKVSLIDLVSPIEEHSIYYPSVNAKTLRMQVAMNAMQGIIARDKSYKYTPATMVQEAFHIADLILKENNQ